MSMGQRGISFVIGAVDKFSAPLAAFNAKMAESTAGLRLLGSRMGNLGRESGFSRLMGAGAGVSRGFGNVAAEATALGSKLALIGGGLVYGFKKAFVDVASEFEDFQSVLTTLNQGDEGKARKDMAWVSDFAAKTPYELAEVTGAFVKLRSYGLDPTNGMLRTLGDTASAMNKPIDQAVEAMADAVTGENERLKEFGIVAKKTGDKIVYSYIDAAGKQAKMMAKASDREAIQATLLKILEKNNGAMERRSKGWKGLLSNLSDGWSRFANMAMDAGAFDWMKDKLRGVLDMVDMMSKDGSLEAWAKQWGQSIKTFFERAWEAGKAFATVLVTIGTGLAWTADLLGGWENLGIAVASLMGLKLVLAVAMLAKSFLVLGAAIMTTPIGWVLAGLTAITIGIVAIWKNWDKIMGWIKEKTPKWILRMFGADESGATSGAGGTAGGQTGGGGLRNMELPALAGWERARSGAFDTPQGWEAAARPSLGAANVQRQINESRSTSLSRQESKITVEVKAPKGTEVRQSGAPVDTDVTWDMGPAMAH